MGKGCKGKGEGIAACYAAQLTVAYAQRLLQFGALLIDLGEEVARHGFVRPGLIIELGTTFLLRIAHHIGHQLKKKESIKWREREGIDQNLP